ncbi:MAG: glycosyltransferase [Promethearchaeota archaeon]
MKFLFVQDTDWISRNINGHHHLYERMILKGHEIRVIDYDILWREEKNKEIISKKRIYKISRLFKNAKYLVIRPKILKIPLLDYLSMFITYRKEIKNQIIEFRPDFIIANGIITTFLAFNLAKKHNIKKVYYSVDVNYRLIPSNFLQPIGKQFEKYNLKKADLVLSINKILLIYTIYMGADPNKVKLLKFGINFDFFDYTIDKNEVRNKFAIQSDDILLLFIGWLYNFSGLKEVILSIKNLKQDNIKLLIIGDGEFYKDLQKIVLKNKMQKKIIMTGFLPYNMIPKFTAAADICILPAYNNEVMRYVVPIKILEYMAMEKPVISTELPGIIKEFGYGNGIIYINKPEDVINKAIDMRDNNQIIQEGLKARKFVENRTWEKSVNQLEIILENLK